MNKLEKEIFINAGGTLLRTGIDKQGNHIVKQRTAQKDWHTRLIVPNANSGQTLIDTLANNHPTKFSVDQ